MLVRNLGGFRVLLIDGSQGKYTVTLIPGDGNIYRPDTFLY